MSAKGASLFPSLQAQATATNGNGAGGHAPSIAVPEVTLKDRFVVLANRFDGFEKELLANKQKKRETDEKKIVALRQDLDVLGELIKEEEKKRIEVTKALRSWFEDKITAQKTEIEAPIYVKLDALAKQIEALNEKIDKLDESVKKDRKTFPKLIEERSSELLKELNIFKARFQVSEKTRDQKEQTVLKSIQEQDVKVQQQFEAERISREAKFTHLREEIDAEVVTRRKGIDLLKQMTGDELTELKIRIEKEVKARETTVEELAAAVNHYSAALQDAIKTMSAN